MRVLSKILTKRRTFCILMVNSYLFETLGEESSEHSSINIQEYLKKREEIVSSSDEEEEN